MVATRSQSQTQGPRTRGSVSPSRPFQPRILPSPQTRITPSKKVRIPPATPSRPSKVLVPTTPTPAAPSGPQQSVSTGGHTPSEIPTPSAHDAASVPLAKPPPPAAPVPSRRPRTTFRPANIGHSSLRTRTTTLERTDDPPSPSEFNVEDTGMKSSEEGEVEADVGDRQSSNGQSTDGDSSDGVQQ